MGGGVGDELGVGGVKWGRGRERMERDVLVRLQGRRLVRFIGLEKELVAGR